MVGPGLRSMSAGTAHGVERSAAEPGPSMGEAAMPTTSVIICTYSQDRCQSLLAAVQSVQAQTLRPDQVIVVVDHNEELMRFLVERLPEAVEVVSNDEARGLAGARNAGIHRASGEVVVFLDDDAEADPLWLRTLVGQFGDPSVAGTGGRVVPDWPMAARPQWFPPEFDWVVGCSYRGLPDVVAPVRNPIGASMAMRRSLFERIGGFDTAMGRMKAVPLGCEETELAIRARHQLVGAEFLYVPDATVTHKVGGERARPRYFFSRCFAEGLSKAALTKRAGSGPALSSERRYLTVTLPRGVRSNLLRACRGELAGVVRAAMIVVGVCIVAVGFFVGRIRPLRSGPSGSGGGPAQRGRRQLLTTFGYLVGQQGLTLILGFAFWAFVVHFCQPSQVGVALATTNTAMLMASLGIVGIPTMLIANFRGVEDGDRRAVLSTALVAAAGLVGLLAVAVVLAAPLLGHGLSRIGTDPVIAVLFVGGAMATAMSVAFDSAAIGARRGGVQLERGISSSAIKFGAVVLFIGLGWRTASPLLIGWVVGLGVSLAWAFRRLQLPALRFGVSGVRSRLAIVRRYGRLSAHHHVLTLAITSVGYLVPVLAAGFVGDRQYAYFATANVVAVAVLALPWLLALSLFAETAVSRDSLSRNIRHSLPLGLGIALAIVVVVEVSASLVLRVFGPTYAAHSAQYLRLLVLLAPLYVIKDHYVAIRRAGGKLISASKVVALGGALECTGALTGAALGGLTFLCIGWVVGAGIEAGVLLPTVLGALRPSTGAAADEDLAPDQAEGVDLDHAQAEHDGRLAMHESAVGS